MWTFNWGVFWAILAALAVRSFLHFAETVYLSVRIDDRKDIYGSPNREITLRDIWERM
jgi:hypothetical protein